MLFLIPLSSFANAQIISFESDEAEGEDEDFEQENSIQICCAWSDALADGELTYFIDEDHSSEEQQEAVRDGIVNWDTKIQTSRN
jgi:hypothetical protein